MRPLLHAVLLVLITSSFLVDEGQVRITISKPLEMDSFYMHDTIPIHVHIESNQSLHNVQIDLEDQKLAFNLFHESAHTHANSYSINKFYINRIKYQSLGYLIVEVKNDEGIIIARKNLTIKLLGKRS